MVMFLYFYKPFTKLLFWTLEMEAMKNLWLRNNTCIALIVLMN